MKYIFRGDLEFCLDNFSSLPYKYVIEAYENAGKLQRNQLHLEEKPVALLSSVIANTNRDTKKKREPYSLDDFCIYRPEEDINIPSEVFGAAAMQLIRNNQFPSWALFTFKDLKASAKGRPPKLLCYSCEDVLILAPVLIDNTVRGLYIMQESAYGKVRTVRSSEGEQLKVRMPTMQGKVAADENVYGVVV